MNIACVADGGSQLTNPLQAKAHTAMIAKNATRASALPYQGRSENMSPDEEIRFECLKLALSSGEDPVDAIERAQRYYNFVADDEPMPVRLVNIANVHSGNDTVH